MKSRSKAPIKRNKKLYLKGQINSMKKSKKISKNNNLEKSISSKTHKISNNLKDLMQENLKQIKFSDSKLWYPNKSKIQANEDDYIVRDVTVKDLLAWGMIKC